MRKMLVGGAAVVSIALAALSGQWLVAADEPAPQRVHFAGCVKPGVEASCLIVESGGQTYNVTSAKDILKIGQFAAGTGLPGGMSICQQGTVLSNIVLDNPQPPHAGCAQ